MTEGEKAPFSFEFTHTGTDTLQIGSLEMCHCTRATYPQNPMLPGEKGHIRGVFDSNGMVGHNEKVIHIWYNREKLPYKIRFLVKVKKKK